MKKILKIVSTASLALGLFVSGAQAGNNDLMFNDPWIRGSVPGQKNGAGYVQITNSSTSPTALTSVRSDRANRVELHTIVREDGVAKMREVKQIDVPASGSVTLKPGGFHIMFIGLKTPFNPGEAIPLQLNFANGDVAQVVFTVKSATFMKSSGGQHKKMAH